jgi:N-acetylmuramoyl-L-alanine amidase
MVPQPLPPRPVLDVLNHRLVLAQRLKFLFAALPLIFSALTATAQNSWDKAVDLRTRLEANSSEDRSREQFEEVLNAFRAIYHQNPNAPKAPAAVAAVADLLAERGRVFSDQRSLRAAIGQYEFLREQYPDSPQVETALLLEGEICREDLKDVDCAEEKFRQVVADMPGTSFAEQAAIELRELETAGAAPAKTSPKTAAPTPKEAFPQAAPAPAKTSSPDYQPINPPAAPAPSVASAISERPARPGHIVTITGMRHWSNPTSTRIAIDLGGKVEYEAARVPNPDRIFFDLHGARLAPSLNGKQVEVIDDGYLRRIRAAQFHPDVTRVVLDVTGVSQYSAFLLPNPWRLIIDIHSDKQGSKSPASVTGYAVSPTPSVPPGAENTIADVAKLSAEPARIPATAGPTSGPVSAKVPGATPAPDVPASNQDHPKPVNPTVSATPAAEIGSTSSATGKKRSKGHNSTAPATSAVTPPPIPHAADPDSDGQRSLVRALGLKVGRIVIDAGHGGHDSGTLGPGGIQEKDVVLDVALRTGKLLHQRLGAEIIYTRSDDTFIPLETRTAIANKAQADLFLSIHANSSPEPEARGVETYYLNFTSDPNALEVAARENAVSTQSVYQLSDLVRKITLKDKIDESREFAADVDEGLFAGLKAGNPGLRDRGVKKAPFVVLIGAQMPSILAEISFLTNPDDAEQLHEPSYRQRIAESLVAGVERYLHGLSGTRPAESAPAKKQAKAPARTSKNSSDEPDGQ